MLRRLADRLIARAENRAPDFVVDGAGEPYLRRWWLIPRNAFFNVYLHQFLSSDDDRALHDHPWLFNCSVLLRGAYLEHLPQDEVMRRAGDWKFRWGAAPHRIELITDLQTWRPAVCWTIFITGPRVREWGFYCERGWVHWKTFTAPGNKGKVGRGCGQ